jgi:hypothetical protein
MASATIGGVECRVTADKDLGDTWAVAVVPPAGSPLTQRVLKLQGNDRAACIKGALTLLKASGRIDDFKLDPAPAPAETAAPPAAPPPAATP